jgi:HEAT repeat protein
MERKRSDVVARRRRVAVAGYRGDELVARAALADPAGDVRATALGALLRMGRLCDDDVEAALSDPEPVVRRRACEVSVAVPVEGVTAALGDPDPLVVEAACFALGERPQAKAGHHPTQRQVTPSVAQAVPGSAQAEPAVTQAEPGSAQAVAALAQVATGHSDPLCREAAIAALGALGDERGLEAILAGLKDKAAVRRRAVIALAPFEGPAVDEALAQARTDRDWQVRQAAEDLLDPAGPGTSG